MSDNKQQTVQLNGNTYMLVEESEPAVQPTPGAAPTMQPGTPQVTPEQMAQIRQQLQQTAQPAQPVQPVDNFENDPRLQNLLALVGYDNYDSMMRAFEDASAHEVANHTGLSVEQVRERERYERGIVEAKQRYEQEGQALTQLTHNRFKATHGIQDEAFESMSGYLGDLGIDINNINTPEQLTLYWNGYKENVGQDTGNAVTQNIELANRFVNQPQQDVNIQPMEGAPAEPETQQTVDASYEAEVNSILADIDKPFTFGRD